MEDILPESREEALFSRYLNLSKKCYTFELNPVLYNLPNKRINVKTVSRDVFRIFGTNNSSIYLPYVRMKHLINLTGELYFDIEDIECEEKNQTINNYNNILNDFDKNQGMELKCDNSYVYLDEYVKNTVFILKKLVQFSSCGNDGQKELNRIFISETDTANIDEVKVSALKNIFVDSKVVMIYGAAGTGKTTLMNYISDLMVGRSKLFLTKTHTALDNLQRRITSPGSNGKFMGIDKFINSGTTTDYDIIFVDECSTIDNRTMINLLKKINGDSLLVFAGDIYQIESIDFGNWFFYAKETLPAKSIVELTSTWRTQQLNLRNLWEEVRFIRPLITEMLVIDGPFSENIGKNIFTKTDKDEVVLCLNYDGKFGLNSINSYFQDANPSEETFQWMEWKYKVGAPVLFNENRRFPMLYNNLKGVIVDIQKNDNSITFTIDVPIILTALDIKGTDLKIFFVAEELREYVLLYIPVMNTMKVLRIFV